MATTVASGGGSRLNSERPHTYQGHYTANLNGWIGRANEARIKFHKFFQNSISSLTANQKAELDRRLLEKLARKSIYWVGTLVVGSFLVYHYGVPDLNHRHPVSLLGWMLGLWGLLLLYLCLLPCVVSLPLDATVGKVRLIHFAWCAWIATVAAWWLTGALALKPPPQIPITGQPFVLQETTFLFFTLIGQIITIMALAPSRFATFSAIVFGYLAPFWGLIKWDLPFTQIHYWITGQLVLDLVIAWFVGADQRDILARGVVAEAERTRANTFVAAISHDLRQPLATLTMKLSSIKRYTVAGRSLRSEEMLAEIKALQEQTSAIETMVAGTLDLTRLSAGTWTVRPREIALNHVIDRVVNDLRPEADAKGVRLEAHTLPYVIKSDPIALSRILRNLIGNALRYTGDPESGREGSVAVNCELMKNDIVRISVTDNGIGIPRDKLEDIFREYVQLDNPERDRIKGLGLGLSIVKGLANLLGHQLAVHSTVGEGSRFSLLVPALGRIPDELLTGHVPIGADATDLAGLVIILVEDAQGPRDAMRDFLMDANCIVVAGASAAEALEILRDELPPQGPHFILADYDLVGGNNGIQAIHEIRETLDMDVPGAIWTAKTDPAVHQEISSEGFELFSKPADEKALLGLLSRYRPIQDLADASGHSEDQSTLS